MLHNSKPVVTRFAPSPTGFLHLGGYRTALFNYIYARQHNGKMILRIEDTDKTRSKKEYEEDILSSLRWLGIDYDELYRQSDRTEVYTRHIKKLLENRFAYESSEEKEGKEGTVIRFKNPRTTVVFKDLIRGEIHMDTKDLGDFVIARSIDDPLYHLAVVVDDFEMGVTHIIRGEDHISNTPRQILIQEAIGAPRALYAHLPLVLAPDRSKLSKRHGALPVREYQNEGYLPHALINFLALLGWSPQRGGNTEESEIFTAEKLREIFSLDHVQKGGAIFNADKLNWINKEHIKKMPLQDFQSTARKFLSEEITKLPEWSEDRFTRAIPVLADRIEKFGDIRDMEKRGELQYFFEAPKVDINNLVWPKGGTVTATKQHINAIVKLLQDYPKKTFIPEEIKALIWKYAEEHGRGEVLWPMRYALSGKDKSPDPFTLASILGKEETLKRLSFALTATDTPDVSNA